MDYLALAKKYKTPLYIYDFDHIKAQYEKLKREFNAIFVLFIVAR